MRARESLRPSAQRQGRTGRLATWAAVLLALVLTGCKTELYTGLDEREANEMIALLMKNGIDASRLRTKDGSSSLQVSESRFADAVDLLKANGYPRERFANMGDVFKTSGLIASPTEERARFIYALGQELSRTINDIDGVITARIHVVLPKNDLLRQDITPSSASVFIRHDARAPLKQLLPQIKMLVANSIEGLAYEKVSVVFVPVDRAAPADGSAVRPTEGQVTMGDAAAADTGSDESHAAGPRRAR
jgi:type III secretion protein J